LRGTIAIRDSAYETRAIILEKRGLRYWLHFAVRPENGKLKNRRKVSMMYV
jgi:hypothetical protein